MTSGIDRQDQSLTSHEGLGVGSLEGGTLKPHKWLVTGHQHRNMYRKIIDAERYG